MDRKELEQILRDIYSKEGIYELADRASKDQAIFLHLWEITKEMPFHKAWRASWVMDHATDKDVRFLYDIIDEVYELFPGLNNESLIRHFLKFLLKCPINVDLGLPVLDKCLEILNNPKAKVAGRGWSLQYFFEFTKVYPDMKYELLGVIDDLHDKEPSAGMKVFMRRIADEVRSWE